MLVDKELNCTFEEIKNMVISSRNKIYSTVNIEMLNLYWNIGKIIVEIQQGEKRAKYGDYVLAGLSVKLTKEFVR